MRPSGPGASQAVGSSSQDSTHDVILVIPVAQPTAEKGDEHGFYIVVHDFRRGRRIIVARIAQAAHRVVAARARTVSPQVVIGLQGRNPDSLSVVVNEVEIVDVRRAEERGKIAIRAGSKRLAVAHPE